MGGRPLAVVAERLAGAGLLTGTRGDLRTKVDGASQDSRTTSPGELFLAWHGTSADAHDHLPQAARRGADAAVVERWVADVELPQLKVSDGRRAAAIAASFLADRPDRRLLTVGVTGTNGKTTTSLIARHLLGALGPAAAMGTVGIVGASGHAAEISALTDSALTTPGPVAVARTLETLADSGAHSVVMEASSHALDQHRLDGVEFDIGVFTNLTRDHLDYHGDFDSYLSAKARLAELVAPKGTLVVNADDPAWTRLEGGGREVLHYSTRQANDAASFRRDEALGRKVESRNPAGVGLARSTTTLRAEGVKLRTDGSEFTCVWQASSYPARISLPGGFNVANSLAALAVATAAGIDLSESVERLRSVPTVPGRLESVITDPFSVFIDFAHTPDALANSLSTLRSLTTGRLIVVFGAGGDRDPGKRAPMGEVAGRLADIVVLTSDNPRSEDPEGIMDDVAAGLPGVPHHREVDREGAIALAIGMAENGDTVLLAGKGHEDYQVLADGKIPFNERVLVRAVLERTGLGVPEIGEAP